MAYYYLVRYVAVGRIQVLCRVCSDASDTQRIWWDTDTVEQEVNYEPVEFTFEQAQEYFEDNYGNGHLLSIVPASFIYPEQDTIACYSFSDTGDAYDSCQCCDYIKSGDVLIIENEKVVGIAGTWPIAITKEHGSLHYLKEGSHLFGKHGALGQFTDDKERDRALRGWQLAEQKAKELGFAFTILPY